MAEDDTPLDENQPAPGPAPSDPPPGIRRHMPGGAGDVGGQFLVTKGCRDDIAAAGPVRP